MWLHFPHLDLRTDLDGAGPHDAKRPARITGGTRSSPTNFQPALHTGYGPLVRLQYHNSSDLIAIYSAYCCSNSDFYIHILDSKYAFTSTSPSISISYHTIVGYPANSYFNIRHRPAYRSETNTPLHPSTATQPSRLSLYDSSDTYFNFRHTIIGHVFPSYLSIVGSSFEHCRTIRVISGAHIFLQTGRSLHIGSSSIPHLWVFSSSTVIGLFNYTLYNKYIGICTAIGVLVMRIFSMFSM